MAQPLRVYYDLRDTEEGSIFRAQLIEFLLEHGVTVTPGTKSFNNVPAGSIVVRVYGGRLAIVKLNPHPDGVSPHVFEYLYMDHAPLQLKLDWGCGIKYTNPDPFHTDDHRLPLLEILQGTWSPIVQGVQMDEMKRE